MQKVIRRTILAEKQAARRHARRKDKATREWAKSNREQNNFVRKDITKNLKDARLNRREDWELGPLAPRRDVGDLKDKYGTVGTSRLRGPELEHRHVQEKLKPFGGKYLNIVTGDRVVLLEGRDKGKIGKITATDTKRAECTVEGLNMVDVSIPEWMMGVDEQDKRPIRAVEQPVPFSSVRLVFPLPDPETGVVRDVIVKKVVNGKIFHDRHNQRTSWARLIPGINVVIPWPKKDPTEKKDYPGDTLRMEVEAKSFVPTLLTPPMPGSVIDELRNKYSIFRTRHDPEYIAAKMAEDAEKEAAKKLSDEMRTPLKEVNRRERKLRKAKGKGKLTPEMLEKIGEVIARKRQLALAAAGVSKVGATPEPLAV